MYCLMIDSGAPAELGEVDGQIGAHDASGVFAEGGLGSVEHRAPAVRHEHQVSVPQRPAVSGAAVGLCCCHRSALVSVVMQLRYRYRIKTRRKVAIVHNEVARARRDYHHKQALALVRENQVIHVEDLNIAGMVRNRRMARVISDAGWGQFVKIIGEKADRYGWTVHAVSRWLASSKTCSACGHRLAELPLQIRQWICPACRAVHDRDHNAAKVILAAGRAERLNACEARVRPQPVAAMGVEAGSNPNAA
jgi:IS605 OrfB family transposase